MNQNNNEERNDIWQTPADNEPVYDEPEFNEPVYSEPVLSEPVYVEPVNNEPVYNEPIYNEPIYSEPLYSEPVYDEPVFNNRENQIPHMYTPGICVVHPYSGGRETVTATTVKPRRYRRRIGRFLRSGCLVLLCALFSAASAYGIMEYRFQRGDFTVNNQVVLGGNQMNQPSGNYTVPVANLGAGISAMDIYDMASSQVVGIITEMPSSSGGFGWQGGTSSPISGSGFIISSDGYILTNYHVIESAKEYNLALNVIINDGTSYPAEIIGFELSNDIALIKINATGLNPVLLGNSDSIRVGQSIYAVGNPGGDLIYTMTDGIVSALDRVISVEGKQINTFQFSAAVNPGNSGGPIYDSNGEVIGIVTAKIIRNIEGIGFAIPINDAVTIALELIEHGYISGRPFIGIAYPKTVTNAHADFYDWAVVGVYVSSVIEDTAAEKAGIEAGDIITAINDITIDSLDSLRTAMRKFRAGDEVTMTIWRKDTSIDLTIIFDEDLYAGQPQDRPSPPNVQTPGPFD